MCAFEYAAGLTKRGHEVTVVPILPSPMPQWFSKNVGTVISSTPGERTGRALRTLVREIRSATTRKSDWVEAIRNSVATFLLARPGMMNIPLSLGLADWYVSQVAPKADINIAVSFEAARPTSLLPGRGFYFLQHFDPYFKAEYPDPVFAEAMARHSYTLGLRLIANSSWLRDRLRSEFGDIDVEVCPNAIDHSVFHGQVKPLTDSKNVVVISYGGRNAVWKGFREMAEAMRIVRNQNPDLNIEWRVYGDALLPPNNDVARYTALGFLPPPRLAEEYRKADILLSASWYESFPLFPIEAMACGLAVITTQYGTEEYAIHGETAEIVAPQSPEKIAEGLNRLVTDPIYREKIAVAGNAMSRNFTWERAVVRLETLISTKC